MSEYLFTFLFLWAFASFSAKSLPSFIAPCPRNHANMTACLINLVETIKPHLVRGIPEMKVPPIDPFYVPAVTMEHGTGSVKFKAHFRNIKSIGGKNFILNDMKVDFDEEHPRIYLNILIPRLRITSDYEINGRILVLPIVGNGKAVGNFTNVSSIVNIEGKHVTRKNKRYMQIVRNKVSLTIGGLAANFSNLFSDKQLSESTNAFINQNWKDIIHEITPLIEETVESIFVGLIQNVLNSFSVDELFPRTSTSTSTSTSA